MTLRDMYDNVPLWRQILSLGLIGIYLAADFAFKLLRYLMAIRPWGKLFEKSGDKTQ